MRERLPLVIVAVGGAFASFWRLATAGWGVDEVTYAEAGEAYLAGDFRLNRGHAWFAKELIGASVKLFGRNELAVRAPGALLGFLTGFLIYALVRRLGGTSLASVA
ncbi:MAG: glycosyltransferase family 39 protein, partial [Acidimicrobiia bacterium]